ncbi:MAG: trypsin-like peptidase domain-containing protein [Chloroflexi bacterium]|nr:trypsin-like peptidase domain-containing protein [Chloroflexota bacterium]
MERYKLLNKKNVKTWLIPVAVGLFLFVLTACSGSAAATAEPTSSATGEDATQTSGTVLPGGDTAADHTAADQLVAAQESVMARIYDKALPSVVNIQVIQERVGNNGTGEFPNGPEEFFDLGEGSGFVWDDKGRIVTNQHVVDGAEVVTVIFADRTQVLAKVLGGDVDSDLAVLELEDLPDNLVPIELGDSDDVFVGQLAVAIGAPFGQTFTMTSGIISAIGRTIRSGSSQFTVPEVIQTDAPINPGNSGGPLLDRFGRVVGINTQIISRSGSSAGIGFSVPINIAKMVVPALIEDGKYEYSWLGISGSTMGPVVAQLMDLPKDTQGTLIISVNSDSPANEGGLIGGDRTELLNGTQYSLGGDTITAINGSQVRDMTDLITYLTKNTRPGDEVMFDVLHKDGAVEQVPIILGTRPGNG